TAMATDIGAASRIVNSARTDDRVAEAPACDHSARDSLLYHVSRVGIAFSRGIKVTTTLARRCLVGLSLLVLAGSAAAQARLWDKPGRCDRDCLKAVVDKYVDAMVKHDAKGAPFAANVKFTENAEAFPIGQGGLWTNATGASKTY